MQAPTLFTGDEPVGGRYELAERVGEGSFAVTYRAHDRVLGRTVAVKMLRAQYAADPTFVARFEREARVAASVSHPNVVDVYDYGAYRDTYFIAMQYVPGRTLKDELEARGPLPASAAVRTAGQILRGLGAIHAAGIVHRDIKPQNVLLGPDRVARVTDFGVAHYPVQGGLTTHGTTVGTAAYMAPEQARGAALGEAADLYSVGVVLFELLTGRLPFEGDNPMAVMLAHLQQPPPQPSEVAPEVEVPPALEAEVMRALAKDPAARRANADEMANALDLSLADRRGSSEAAAIRWPTTDTATRQVPVAAEPAILPASRAAVSAPSRTAIGPPTAASPRQMPQASLPPIRSRRRGAAWLAPVALFGLAVAALGGLAASGADLDRFGVGTGDPTSIAVVSAPEPTEPSLPPQTTTPPSSAPIVLQITPVPTTAPTGAAETEIIGAVVEPTASPSPRATATRAPDPTATATIPTVASTAPPSPTARITPAPTVTPRPTSTPRPTPSPTTLPAPSPTATTVRTVTATPIPIKPTVTVAPSATATPAPAPVAVDRGASGVVGGNLPGPASATEPPPQPVSVVDVPSEPTAAPVETDDVNADPTAAPVERDENALGFLSGPGITFFDAQEWRGAMNADAGTYGKPSVAIYGVDSGSSSATLSFTLEEPISRMDLWLSGQGDETGIPFQFALVVNGAQSQPITSPFPQWNGRSPSWSAVPFSIGRDLLRAGTNTISVVSLQPGAHEGVPPYLLLAEASLAPADAAVDESAAARDQTVNLIDQPAVSEGNTNEESKKANEDPKNQEKGSRETDKRGRGNGGGDDGKKDED